MPHILLVDDDPHDRELALAALRSIAPEAEIAVASDGEEALSYLVEETGASCPDLVVLDYKMPKVSGADVLRAVRQHPQACRSPIVMFSGSDSERDIQECYELGARAYVRKPSGYKAISTALSGVVAFWTTWNVPDPQPRARDPSRE